MGDCLRNCIKEGGSNIITPFPFIKFEGRIGAFHIIACDAESEKSNLHSKVTYHCPQSCQAFCPGSLYGPREPSGPNSGQRGDWFEQHWKLAPPDTLMQAAHWNYGFEPVWILLCLTFKECSDDVRDNNPHATTTNPPTNGQIMFVCMKGGIKGK